MQLHNTHGKYEFSQFPRPQRRSPGFAERCAEIRRVLRIRARRRSPTEGGLRWFGDFRFREMAIARAIRAAGKQVTATGRPVRMIRPVRLKPRDPALPVRAPQGQEFWDSPNIKTAVGMALAVVLAKLTMMYDEAQEPERIERQAREFAEVQANLKPLTEEQWEEVQELRPRTPFESKIGRSHARIRTGEASSLEDIKDWAIDVLVEAMTRKEETAQRSV